MNSSNKKSLKELCDLYNEKVQTRKPKVVAQKKLSAASGPPVVPKMSMMRLKRAQVENLGNRTNELPTPKTPLANAPRFIADKEPKQKPL